jgi:squalene-associated FAD-dependent desaturase
MHHPDVAVIGAGFAGLAAATALAESGAVVAVHEARPGLGGRATAHRDPVTGERIDNGQHVLAGCYVETLAFLKRIGTLGRLHRPAALRVPMIDENGHTTTLSLPPLPAPLHLLAGVLAWPALTPKDRLSILRVAVPIRSGRVEGDAGTVRDWLVRHGQSPRLCRLLWEPLALAALNQPIEAANAQSFVTVLHRLFGPEPDASTLLLPAVPLDDLYARPAADYVRERGGDVGVSSPARVLVENGRVTGVRVRDRDEPVRMVIVAVPWFALRAVFDEPPAGLGPVIANASALASSPIVTVNLWLEGCRLPEPLIGLPGRQFQWAFDRRAIAGADHASISMVSSGADAICARPNDELIDLACRELGTALTPCFAARVRHAVVVRERRATFSLRPGAPERPGTRTAVEGLLLAGDWIDTGLPATIESAVVAGHAAARAALSAEPA